MRRIQAAHPEVDTWVCVGDVADDEGCYQECAKPLYFIKGNNEGFDTIAAGTLPTSLHFIDNGQKTVLGTLRVVGLGGTLAPTWYEVAASQLPHPHKAKAQATAQADKRRHFVREEVERCLAFSDVDLFLTHEAPRPYVVGRAGSGGRGVDAGKTPINEVLARMRPRLHLFGHHHRFTEQQHGVRSVGLDVVSVSYLLIDIDTMEYVQVKS